MRKEFPIDYNIETKPVSPEWMDTIENSLFDLQNDHKDLVGAACSIERIGGDGDPVQYQVRIEIYRRPENLVVVEKGSPILDVIQDALGALERRVRKARQKRTDLQTSPPARIGNNLLKMIAPEILDTFESVRDKLHIKQLTRQELAHMLMKEGNLSEKQAYWAADKLIRHSEKDLSQ